MRKLCAFRNGICGPLASRKCEREGDCCLVWVIEIIALDTCALGIFHSWGLVSLSDFLFFCFLLIPGTHPLTLCVMSRLGAKVWDKEPDVNSTPTCSPGLPAQLSTSWQNTCSSTRTQISCPFSTEWILRHLGLL